MGGGVIADAALEGGGGRAWLDLSGVPSGVYLAEVTAGVSRAVRRIAVIR
jgi:hypothetical protein